MLVNIGLIGNPNSGKTTLFNRLTGSKQRVGNWPGVTVERKQGQFSYDGTDFNVVDLPGLYSLIVSSEQSEANIDEQITRQYLEAQEYDLIINVLDSTNLQRDLYLSLQLIELGIPVLIVCNLIDLAEKQGLTINIAELAKQLKCPVIAIDAQHGKGIEKLKQKLFIFDDDYEVPAPLWLSELDPVTWSAAIHLMYALEESTLLDEAEVNILSRFAVEGDVLAQQKVHKLSGITIYSGEQHDINFATARHQFISELLDKACQYKLKLKPSLTNKLDKIVLNRVLGLPIFLSIIYAMFVFALTISGAFQDFFDLGSQAIFINGVRAFLTNQHAPEWLIALLANGVGQGINTTITFVPVIGGMYLFLSLLEGSGYMARAAFVMDRFMRALGLPGKAFAPLIIGFGCNVPAVLATRTLGNRTERIVTSMMSPFMSCGARLAIFTAFVAAFFPQGGHNIVFLLYIIGILAALLTGVLLKHTFVKAEGSLLVMELPDYRWPSLANSLRHASYRLRRFIWRAAKYIIPLCVVFGSLNSLGTDGTYYATGSNPKSVLAAVGQTVTPALKPMGIAEENWPATLGLMSGVIAKEVVIGTLNSLYHQQQISENIDQTKEIEQFSLLGELQNAANVTWYNILAIPNNLFNPITSYAQVTDVGKDNRGISSYFSQPAAVFAYLLFVLLYVPCVSTMGAISQELSGRWALFSMVWSTSLAYFLAVLCYQFGTFSVAPMQHFKTISISLLVWAIFLAVMFYSARRLNNEKNSQRSIPIKLSTSAQQF